MNSRNCEMAHVYDERTSFFLTGLFDFILLNIIFSNAFMVLNLPNIFLSFISLLRDFSIIIIIFFLGVNRIYIKSNSNIYAGMLLVYFIVPIFIYFANLIDSQNLYSSFGTIIRGVWWTIRPFLLFLVLLNYKKFYQRSINLSKYLIKTSILMFFISILFYICFPNFISSMRFETRISLGNPSMQSSIFNGAMIILLDKLPFSRKINYLFLLLLIVATVCTISLTGIACLFVTLAIYLMEKEDRKYIIPICGILIIIIFTAIISNQKLMSYVDFFLQRMQELQKVLNKYLFIRMGDSGSNSFRAREWQIREIRRTLEASSYIFGCGDINCMGGRYGVENFYYALLTNYGVIGVLFFFFAQIKIFFMFIRSPKKNKKYSLLTFLVYLNFYSTSLDLINTYSLSSIFIFVGFILCNSSKVQHNCITRFSKNNKN